MMLLFAEDECRRRKRARIDLSTSEVQSEALSLYRRAGYQLVREGVAVAESNKTLGAGIRRFHFHEIAASIRNVHAKLVSTQFFCTRSTSIRPFPVDAEPLTQVTLPGPAALDLQHEAQLRKVPIKTSPASTPGLSREKSSIPTPTSLSQ